MPRLCRTVLAKLLAGPASAVLAAVVVSGPPPGLLAQSTAARPDASVFPEDVSFVVRIDGRALAGSPLLPSLLRRPEAANGLAQALGRPSILSKIRAVYVGMPASFTPATTELPVLVVGDFGSDEILDELDRASGVERADREGRALLEATGGAGTTYATPLGEGALAVGDYDSVRRMVEVREGKRRGIDPPALPGSRDRDVAGAGEVPRALRGYLRTSGGVGAPFASVDRLTFGGSLDRAVRVEASLHATTAEGRQGIQQALGGLALFGPARFANDPEVLSAIQSIRFDAAGESVEVSLTVPRSLLLRLL